MYKSKYPALLWVMCIFAISSGCEVQRASEAKNSSLLAKQQVKEGPPEETSNHDVFALQTRLSWVCSNHKIAHVAETSELREYTEKCNCDGWFSVTPENFERKNARIRRDTITVEQNFNDPEFCGKATALPNDH